MRDQKNPTKYYKVIKCTGSLQTLPLIVYKPSTETHTESVMELTNSPVLSPSPSLSRSRFCHQGTGRPGTRWHPLALDSQEMLNRKRKGCPRVCWSTVSIFMARRIGSRAKKRPKVPIHVIRDVPSAMFFPQLCQQALLLTLVRAQVLLLSVSSLLKLEDRHHSHSKFP